MNRQVDGWGPAAASTSTLAMGLTDFACDVNADLLRSQCGLTEGDPGLSAVGASPVQEHLQASSGGHEPSSVLIRRAAPGSGPPVAQRHALDSWLGCEGTAHQSPGLNLEAPVSISTCCPVRLRPAGKILDSPYSATSGTQFSSLVSTSV